MRKSRLFVATALALTAALGVGMAQARDVDVQWSVTIGAPLLIQPLPVYAQPLPIHGRSTSVMVLPVPVYRQSAYLRPTRWDLDGDGIPNRQDRLYNPQWDRDGDGIPNQRDRYDNRRQGRAGDGVRHGHAYPDAQGWRGR